VLDSSRRRFLADAAMGVFATLLPWSAANAASGDVPELVTLHLYPKPSHMDHEMAPALIPWETWAGAHCPTYGPDITPEDATTAVGWMSANCGGLSVANARSHTIRLRMAAHLNPGLWRIEAAMVPGALDTNGVAVQTLPADNPPSLWRMEGALLSTDGALAKTVDLPSGCALYVRWIETGDAALTARKAVRQALWTTTNSALQDRVSGALSPVDDILDTLPLLVERGDRARITRRIHTALLATAKAQALWENGRGLAIDDPDAPFADLVTALSEIACAAFNLVPSQSLVPAAGATPAHLNISLTNSGTRTVPLVALGVEHTGSGHAVSDLSVSRALAPGGSVSKSFPIVGDPTDVRGIVQFVSDYGAATVAATPTPPPATPATTPLPTDGS